MECSGLPSLEGYQGVGQGQGHLEGLVEEDQGEGPGRVQRRGWVQHRYQGEEPGRQVGHQAVQGKWLPEEWLPEEGLQEEEPQAVQGK